MRTTIEKRLSPNDIGDTGAHQGGMLIPKQEELLAFFPYLNRNDENPRTILRFMDKLGQEWKFNFIYYNNRLRGGTRNEFRLTGMTRFLKQNSAKAGDIVILENDDGEYSVHIRRERDPVIDEDGCITLVLDNTWKVINF